MVFHEFLFLIGLIALRCIDSSTTIQGKLHDFYTQKLNLQKPSEKNLDHDLSYTEVLERVQTGQDNYNTAEGSSQEEWDGEEEEESEEEL